MTSKLVVNTIEADTGISSVSFASSISMDSTSKFHFSAAGVDIGADTNINRPAAGVLGFNISGAEKLRIDTNGHLNTSGIVTAANFKTGVTNLHSTGLTLTGGQLDVGSNIKVGTAGVVTATTFSGSGASLTSLPAGNLTGTVPTARLGSGTASSSTFLAGDSTFKTVSGTTINNNADNRVITGSGTANTLEGESTFTHNPSTFDTVISHNGNSPADLIIENTHNSFTGAVARLTISSGDNSNVGGMIELECNGQTHTFESRKNGNLYIGDNGTTKLTLDSSGHLNISDGNLRINTAGHGIDFSADGNVGGMTSELLDDYEEGTWSPSAGGFTMGSVTSASYTKIGRLVHVSCYVNTASGSSGVTLSIGGLPYTVKSGNYYQYAAGRIGNASFTNSANDIVFEFGTGGTTVYPKVQDGGMNWGMASGTHIIFSGSYIT